jgi:PAS domain S-box-containing protein
MCRQNDKANGSRRGVKMPAMRIRALGPPQFWRDGVTCRAATRKATALTAYLAMQPDRRFRREAIADLLWGEKGEFKARHSLCQAIADARSAFGRDILGTDSSHIWSPHGAADLDALMLDRLDPATAPRNELESIEQLYQGDFLEGMSFSDELFDEWLTSVREKLRQRASDCMHAVLRTRLHAGDHNRALATANRIVDLDPFDELAHRAIMRCHAEQGENHRAIEHFRAVEAELQHELGVSPCEKTKDLYREIASGKSSFGGGRSLLDCAFVLEQLPCSIIVTDLDSKIVGWNQKAEEEFGFSKQEMIGCLPTVLHAQQGNSKLARLILTQATTTGKWVGEVTLKTKNGQTIRQRRIVTPLLGRGGIIIGTVGHGLAF